MGLKFINHNGNKYPQFQSEGNAAQFAIPFAENVLYGKGIDIGCNRKDWAYPHAYFLVDPEISKDFDAMNLPDNDTDHYGQWDYFFSSHLLEHLNDFVGVLEYWHSKLKPGAVLFLYLPSANAQSYWRPWFNRKHVNYFTPEIFNQYFTDKCDLWNDFYVSETDGNCSFIAYASKRTLPIENKLQQSESDIPTGHYPVKDSLLYNLTQTPIIKPLNQYDAGDRISETEYLLLIDRPFYKDRMGFEEDTWPSDSQRFYTIKAIKR